MSSDMGQQLLGFHSIVSPTTLDNYCVAIACFILSMWQWSYCINTITQNENCSCCDTSYMNTKPTISCDTGCACCEMSLSECSEIYCYGDGWHFGNTIDFDSSINTNDADVCYGCQCCANKLIEMTEVEIKGIDGKELPSGILILTPIKLALWFRLNITNLFHFRFDPLIKNITFLLSTGYAKKHKHQLHQYYPTYSTTKYSN